MPGVIFSCRNEENNGRGLEQRLLVIAVNQHHGGREGWGGKGEREGRRE